MKNILFEKFKKPTITPNQKVFQSSLFEEKRYGVLYFFLVISYRKTNTFFSFYCKSSKIPSKIFLFCKYSIGLESRDAIRKKEIPNVSLRGRRKTQFQYIRFKYNQIKAYIYEFGRLHPEMAICKNFNIIYKVYKLDYNIINLMNYKFIFNIFLKSGKLTTIVSIPIKTYVSVKFPHNGCRPKKVRRLKKKRRK